MRALLLLSLMVSSPALAAEPGAEVGKPAPDFTLKSLDDKPITLSKLKGKIVVLEWFSPTCPFVRYSHTKGSLYGVGGKDAKAVWLAVNSNAPGRGGSDPAAPRKSAKDYRMEYPVLMDPDGAVGRLYGATRTPEVVIIDAAGVVRYRGGVDSTGGEEIEVGAKVRNYVMEVVLALRTESPLPVTRTKPWGCTVKYAPTVDKKDGAEKKAPEKKAAEKKAAEKK